MISIGLRVFVMEMQMFKFPYFLSTLMTFHGIYYFLLCFSTLQLSLIHKLRLQQRNCHHAAIILITLQFNTRLKTDLSTLPFPRVSLIIYPSLLLSRAYIFSPRNVIDLTFQKNKKLIKKLALEQQVAVCRTFAITSSDEKSFTQKNKSY